jgi:hypothetical protein
MKIMARRSSQDQFTIVQLEQLLQNRKSKIATLQRQRDKLARKLQKMDDRIRSLGGDGATGRGRNGVAARVRNEISLMDTIESVLKSSGKPMRVGDIAAAVQSRGYRSNSANFRAIVNQGLIKDKRFISEDRGLYQLKK